MTELFVVPKSVPTQAVADSTLPPDWKVRVQALDIQQSWIVEAPAGSGKTGLLIQRFLKLLADESVQQPEQVLAITFTVKATSEMRDRIVHQLQLATGLDHSKSAFDRETRTLAEAALRHSEQLGWDLLNHPHLLNIRTIDSVCAQIVRLLPVLSGGGGALSPVEDASALYREAARRALMQLGGEDAQLDASLRTLLLHRDGSLKNCEQLLADILPLRDQWGELVPLSGAELTDDYLDTTVRPQLQRALEQAVIAGLARLSAAFPREALSTLASLAGEMGRSPGNKGEPSPIAHCAGISTAPQATAEHLNHWHALIHLLTTKECNWRNSIRRDHLRFEIEKHHQKQLELILHQLRDNTELLTAIQQAAKLPPAQYPDEQWEVAKALFRVLRHTLVELQLVFAERNECDFTELGLLARAVLSHEGSSGDLAEALGMKFQHLLVDEMQDTSTGQYNLLEILTRGWDGHSQTLFLVGDPKQSIYLFRQARVERFVRTMLTGRLGDLPLGRLQLTANFRSQSGLVHAFNDGFSRLFPPEASPTNPEDVPYVEATPIRNSTSGTQSVVWHGTVLPYARRGERERAARRTQAVAEAKSVRAIIEQWRACPLPPSRTAPWKIAVLVRSRNLLSNIIPELKAGAIPYRAVDIDPLEERQEVLDLFALTRALLHPADRTAWLTVLRAPWCGLGLSELHMLTGADDPEYAECSIEDILAERGDLLSEESCLRLARLWPAMRAAAEKRPLLTTAQLVERTWRSFGGDAYLGPGETANALRYLELLDEIEAREGTIDLALLQHRMKDLFATTHAPDDAVDLMTIHKAKGLEWDVVIVPRLEKPGPNDKGRLIEWEEFDSDGDTAHIVLAPIEGKGQGSSALRSWLRGIRGARDAAEQKRIFYVVCTRAKEELHLFAAPMLSANGEINNGANSLLKTAWPIAQKHFVTPPLVVSKTDGPPTEPDQDEEQPDLALAAVAEEAGLHPPLLRLPLTFNPHTRFEAPARPLHFAAAQPKPVSFTRPIGSFEARTFGNAVHAFLEVLAKRAARGETADTLLNEVATWTPRITAMLRADGLPPNLLEPCSRRVMTALNNTLHDAEGRWLLTANEESSSELALISWQQERTSVRLDRIFRAGPEPLTAGTGCIWIVDYKTTTHGSESVENFLAAERTAYEPQLETYARIIRAGDPAADICVGLYFPLLPRLVWWKPHT